MRLARGFSLVELLIVIAVIGIIAAIAVPNLVESKKAANESSAISSVRTLTSAQITYASTIGSGSYATLGQLETAGMIDNVLGSGMKDGYSFTTTPNGSTSFTVLATPVTDGVTGERSFYCDQTGVIRYALDGQPDGSSTPLGDSGGGS